MNKLNQYPRVLTIAGSDSGGGAGIQADIKTISANNCYALSVITALTAQNTLGVTGIHPVPVAFVEQQLEAVLGDIGADAIKIGMLFSPPLIKMIANHLHDYSEARIVLDPVMVAQSGDRLIEDEAVAALKEHLIPLADIITPNLPEAAVLLNSDLESMSMMEESARALARLGCPNVLLKGGHRAEALSTDVLFLADTNTTISLAEKRIATNNNHGTGCTLSSAIAAALAKGSDIEGAVREAKTYITGAIGAGARYQIGTGHGPVHHFYRHF